MYLFFTFKMSLWLKSPSQCNGKAPSLPSLICSSNHSHLQTHWVALIVEVMTFRLLFLGLFGMYLLVFFSLAYMFKLPPEVLPANGQFHPPDDHSETALGWDENPPGGVIQTNSQSCMTSGLFYWNILLCLAFFFYI